MVGVMRRGAVLRGRLHQIFAILVCVWLGLGPAASAAQLWKAEHDCCCGGGSVCLLGACDCGERSDRGTSPCGGLRSADDANSGVGTLSFVRDLGVGTGDGTGLFVECVGHSTRSEFTFVELASPAPEPPPPRSASAC